MLDSLAIDPQEPRTRRIVEVALRLAVEGGFSAVRLRDVAEQAGVALRTLYKRFPSKDDLLFAVLVGELLDLERRLGQRPVQGTTPVGRLCDLFERLTGVVCGRPNLGRAIVRALAGGSTRLPHQVAGFNVRINGLIVGAIADRDHALPTDPAHRHQRLGAMLQHVWFSSLVAWSSGLHSPGEVVAAVADAAALVLEPPG